MESELSAFDRKFSQSISFEDNTENYGSISHKRVIQNLDSESFNILSQANVPSEDNAFSSTNLNSNTQVGEQTLKPVKRNRLIFQSNKMS